MADQKRTLVLGASMNPERYSNKAIKSLRAHGHPVVAVGLRNGMVDDTPINKELPLEGDVHTVTVYLNAANQQVLEERILALKPQRIIFNPGAENAAFAQRAERAGVATVEGCTLVMLSIGAF